MAARFLFGIISRNHSRGALSKSCMVEVRVPFLSRIHAPDPDGHWIRSEVAGRFSWNKIGLAYANRRPSAAGMKETAPGGRKAYGTGHMRPHASPSEVMWSMIS